MRNIRMAFGALVLTLSSLSTAGAARAAEAPAASANPVIITSAFVGVVRSPADLPTQPASSNTVTWIGEPSGKTTVLWAAHPPIDLRDANGLRVTPMFVGKLGPDQLDQVRARIGTSAAATAWGHGITVCSLNVANPYWNSSVNQARGGVSQVCSNFSSQRVSERLYKNIGLVPVLQDTDSFGPATLPFVSAIGLRGCIGSTARSWANQGHGEAWANGVYFNGPTEVASQSLGCG